MYAGSCERAVVGTITILDYCQKISSPANEIEMTAECCTPLVKLSKIRQYFLLFEVINKTLKT